MFLFRMKNWLVVSTPLKNISQLGLLFPIYGKIKHVPNHQPGKNMMMNPLFFLGTVNHLSHTVLLGRIIPSAPAVHGSKWLKFSPKSQRFHGFHRSIGKTWNNYEEIEETHYFLQILGGGNILMTEMMVFDLEKIRCRQCSELLSAPWILFLIG